MIEPTQRKKKLIEVALPLDDINRACAREKSIRHGHPATLHLWWARRPLAAARAVIFAQLVDDPSEHPDLFPAEADQEHERERLFAIIRGLVEWENTDNQELLRAAQAEIERNWRLECAENKDHPRAKELFDPKKVPSFCDPFSGGGSLPLEAQRLGLEAYSSDLNPIAVLINKAMIEIPPTFAGAAPINPVAQRKMDLLKVKWSGAEGLAEDVRYYGNLLREQAETRVAHLYPKVTITREMLSGRTDLEPLLGQRLTVVAWLWARVVKSPNPAFADVDVPLISTFVLSSRAGKEAYVEPLIDGRSFSFTVRSGRPADADAVKSGTKMSRGAFRCLFSGTPIPYEYIDGEANAGRMGARLIAIVAESPSGRIYLPPLRDHELAAADAEPSWRPDVQSRGTWASNAQGRQYGFHTFSDYFTSRQLTVLDALSDLVLDVRETAKMEAVAAGMAADPAGFNEAGAGAQAYADAVATYLSLAVDKVADYNSSLVVWSPTRDQAKTTFSRQGLPMVWDFAEVNPFAHAAGDLGVSVEGIAKSLARLGGGTKGHALQADAQTQQLSQDKIVSTDPPYYDNISYADLSDFFYVWLRRSLRTVFPDLFSTVSVPKAQELVANIYRHNGKEAAEKFFLDGMASAMHSIASGAHPAFPATFYYAFKQSETDAVDGTISTGWQTFLEAVVSAGFSITGTWPMRTEREARSIGIGTNSLASSIILVCRPRPTNATSATRREFLDALKSQLPIALSHLQASNIAPVDLAQAAIGPGMAIYTSYAKVLDAEGGLLPVREALSLINSALDEVLAEQEGDLDAETRFAISWFEQNGFDEGEFGASDVLARAKNTSVTRLAEIGIVASRAGKVRLRRPSEMPAQWDPTISPRVTTWEIVHQLVRALGDEGEYVAAQLSSKFGSKAEAARELAYRLYTIAERCKRTTDARTYNELVQSWPEIMRLGSETGSAHPVQADFLGAL